MDVSPLDRGRGPLRSDLRIFRRAARSRRSVPWHGVPESSVRTKRTGSVAHDSACAARATHRLRASCHRVRWLRPTGYGISDRPTAGVALSDGKSVRLSSHRLRWLGAEVRSPAPDWPTARIPAEARCQACAAGAVPPAAAIGGEPSPCRALLSSCSYGARADPSRVEDAAGLTRSDPRRDAIWAGVASVCRSSQRSQIHHELRRLRRRSGRRSRSGWAA